MLKIVHVQCHRDSDCREGWYCHEKLGNRICQECIDCSDRFARLPSKKTTCSRSWLECGGCQRGFKENVSKCNALSSLIISFHIFSQTQPLAGGEVREKCVPNSYGGDTTLGPEVRLDEDTGELWYSERAFNRPLYYIILGVAAVLVVAVVIAAIWWLCRRAWRKRRVESANELPPG